MKNIVFLILLLFSLSCTKQNKEISLKEKIKSMIMIGLRDEDIDYALANRNFDHFILFAQDVLTQKPRNATSEENLKKLTKKLKENGIKLIAVDNEGGAVIDENGKLIDLEYRGVNRLYNIKPFNEMPFVDAYSIKTSEEIKKDALKYAKKMYDLGINFNIAPVIDVKINNDKDFFMNKKHRIISADKKTIVRVAKAFIAAYDDYNIATCLKHFPGHGSAKNDSHNGFTDITKTWSENELYSFRKLIDINFADTVMVGHLFNKKIDSKYPASMSYKTIQKLLREELEFEGVIISDSLDMKAIIDQFSLKKFIINFINAGGDIIVYANQLKYDKNIGNTIYNIIVEAIINKEIEVEKINTSYQRIIKLYNTTK